MRNARIFLSFSFALLLVGSLFAQQQTSKSKSADKLYEKGNLSNNVVVRNAQNINSEALDYSPTFYANGIVYVTTRHKNGPKDKKLNSTFMELYYAELEPDGMPIEPDEFSVQINSQVHEGPVSFSRNGSTMYFTRNNLKKGLTKANSKGKIVLKIYEAKRGDYDWEDVKELPFNSDEYSCFHPSLSADGNTIYFASDMPGGLGGMDLFKVEKRADSWSEPINLGEGINTPENEAFPYIHRSGALFFSSNGHESIGGLDMFMADWVNGEWSSVKSLGEPFNSPQDDLGFIINNKGTRGYFASDRDGGKGKDDIYLFEADNTIIEAEKELNLNAKIIAYNMETNAPIEDVSIRILERASDGFAEGDDLYDIQLLPGGDDGSLVMKLVRKSADKLGESSMFTDQKGEIDESIKSNKNYLVLGSKKGFESSEIVFSTQGESKDQVIRMPMKPRTCSTMSGVVTAEEYGTRIPNAMIKIVNECTGAEEIIYANSNGEFETCLPLGCEYAIYAEKTGYTKGLSKISTVNPETDKEVEVNVKMNPIVDNIINEPIKEGSVIVLENIYYDFDKSAIRKGAARELDALVELMKSYPSMEVEMIAHTDSRGGEEYNLDLSLRRAESARKYLIRNSIAETRIKAFGYGESQLRNDCFDGVDCTEGDHEYNRRTEVRITKIDEPVKVQYDNGKPNNGRMD
ncbi:MAG: OmpA family protein [Saprospiraceae bacterium]|jgi:outer membrane protein OmpA-like peptidoglycan-associated protein|nr:OmpA family protein [Saprospiraceae bacterium]